jgi:hypothetical protein
MPGISVSAGAGGDRTTGAAIAVDYAHHEIHEGDAFQVSHAEDIGSSSTYKFLITTPDTTKWIHMFAFAIAEIEAEIRVYEAPTTPSAGSDLTAYNKNRNSAAVTGLTAIKRGIATVADGTLIQTVHIGSGRTAGGDVRSENEWVLKQNTSYVIAIQNFSGSAANYCTLVLNWYEHTNY